MVGSVSHRWNLKRKRSAFTKAYFANVNIVVIFLFEWIAIMRLAVIPFWFLNDHCRSRHLLYFLSFREWTIIMNAHLCRHIMVLSLCCQFGSNIISLPRALKKATTCAKVLRIVVCEPPHWIPCKIIRCLSSFSTGGRIGHRKEL